MSRDSYFRPWLPLAAMGALAITGCAALSEGECLTVDWHERGVRDGTLGAPRSRLHEYDRACAKHGVRPDQDAYYAGREIGLERYCTPEGGYRAGREGLSYLQVCPPDTEEAFRDAYREGWEIHEVEGRMESVVLQIRVKEGQIADEDTSDADRERLREEVRSLNEQYRLLSEQLIRLERSSDW